MGVTRSRIRKLIFGGAVVGGAGLGLGAGAVAGLGLAYWGFRQSRRYRLQDRVVVITGGFPGLWFAFVRGFFRRGAEMGPLARDPGDLQRGRQVLARMGNVFVRPFDILREK